MKDSKQTLLIVDDVPENITVLSDILSPHYQLRATTSGASALSLIRQMKPDLVLLDIMMPEMDGYTVCRAIKEDPATAAIPVIFVTAMGSEVDEARGLGLGAVDYITKPISAPVVLARVATQIKLRQMQRSLEQQNRRLEEAAQLRDDVEHIMRHDLKSPLNSIIATPTLLASRYPFSPEDAQLLRSVERAGHKMLTMINRSLDLYKMESGTYPLSAQPIDLLPVVRNALKEVHSAPCATNREGVIRLDGVEATPSDTCWARAEEMLCYPLFSNLILNAFEAAPEQSTVEIALQPGEEQVAIEISNRGTIPASIQARFFCKYVTEGKEGGTGLGTYSAKLCAETQNGSIALLPAEGDRTRIRVTLPAAKSEVTLETLHQLFS